MKAEALTQASQNSQGANETPAYRDAVPWDGPGDRVS
jgi:hypothetical protein